MAAVVALKDAKIVNEIDADELFVGETRIDAATRTAKSSPSAMSRALIPDRATRFPAWRRSRSNRENMSDYY